MGPAPAVFVDREDEFARLDTILDTADPAAGTPVLTVVTGLGGVGKSALALKWLHRVRTRFPDGQLHADLRESASGHPAAPEEILARFLRALGTAAEHVPAALDEQVALFRSVTAGRRLLLLLDNAATAAQVRAVLPASGGSLVVVTTRQRLGGLVVDGARFVELKPFGRSAALGLLDLVLGPDRVRAEGPAAARLVDLCGRLPIAVAASAARLALRPRWSIERLVGELADTRRRLSMLSADGDISPQAVFDVSYRVLAEEEATLYRRLGLHPGPAFGPQVAAAAGGIDHGDAYRILDALSGANLMAAEDDDRFRFHDLLHLHAHAKALEDDPPEVRTAAFARIAEWYLRSAVAADLVVIPGRWHVGPLYDTVPPATSAFTGPAEALDWLETELPNFRAVLEVTHRTGMHDTTWQMCESLWGLFINRKNYRAWLETHEMGLASARTCGDRRAEARMLLALAGAKLNVQAFGDAASLCEDAIVIERSTGHLLGEAAGLSSLGTAYLGMGRPERAAERFEQARVIHESLGRPRGVALMTRRLGEAYRDMGRYGAAAEHLDAAYQIFHGIADGYNQARTLTALGQTHLRSGHPHDAVRPLGEALRLAEEIGAHHERATVLTSLAEAHGATGDRARARDHLVTAVEIFTRLGAPQAESARDRLAALDSGEPPGP
ncbi:tetratricopeptide repeat protein [Sphaerisporangium aureirubrum]|uniref:Tetratricopeptide repeat protein n=1 Tax=Sphaerisporangium aureirubrum TaxID=1544736 RepID=A0ABW1NV02_9ACTN